MVGTPRSARLPEQPGPRRIEAHVRDHRLRGKIVQAQRQRIVAGNRVAWMSTSVSAGSKYSPSQRTSDAETLKSAKQFHEFPPGLLATVDHHDLRRLGQRKLEGNGPGHSPGPQENHAPAGRVDLPAERFHQGPAFGVVAHQPRLVAEKVVDGADRFRMLRQAVQVRENGRLVRVAAVAAAEAHRLHALHGGGEVLGPDFTGEVSPVELVVSKRLFEHELGRVSRHGEAEQGQDRLDRGVAHGVFALDGLTAQRANALGQIGVWTHRKPAFCRSAGPNAMYPSPRWSTAGGTGVWPVQVRSTGRMPLPPKRTAADRGRTSPAAYLVSQNSSSLPRSKMPSRSRFSVAEGGSQAGGGFRVASERDSTCPSKKATLAVLPPWRK